MEPATGGRELKGWEIAKQHAGVVWDAGERLTDERQKLDEENYIDRPAAEFTTQLRTEREDTGQTSRLNYDWIKRRQNRDWWIAQEEPSPNRELRKQTDEEQDIEDETATRRQAKYTNGEGRWEADDLVWKRAKRKSNTLEIN
jgi:hypothetical protein